MQKLEKKYLSYRDVQYLILKLLRNQFDIKLEISL